MWAAASRCWRDRHHPADGGPANSGSRFCGRSRRRSRAVRSPKIIGPDGIDALDGLRWLHSLNRRTLI